MGINKRIVCVAALGIGLMVGGLGKGQTQPSEPGLPLTVWLEKWAEVSSVELASAQMSRPRLLGKLVSKSIGTLFQLRSWRRARGLAPVSF
jgi:hypothetical protein